MEHNTFLMDLAPILPEAEGTKDFVILGSKSGFMLMIISAAAIAVAVAAFLIVKAIKKK